MKEMISIEDYSRLMRTIGNIEGCALGVEGDIGDYIVDCVSEFSEILAKYSPVKAEKRLRQDVLSPCFVCDKQGQCGTCPNNPLLAVKTAPVVEI